MKVLLETWEWLDPQDHLGNRESGDSWDHAEDPVLSDHQDYQAQKAA